MIVRRLGELEGTERDVEWGNGRSRRFLLARDGMGYTVTDTIVDAGTSSRLEYKRHLESCYCIEGEGEVVLDSGESHRITPGTMYALDQHEPHFLRARTRMRLICVFTPALEGSESHKERLVSGGGTSSY